MVVVEIFKKFETSTALSLSTSAFTSWLTGVLLLLTSFLFLKIYLILDCKPALSNKVYVCYALERAKAQNNQEQ